MADRDRHAPTQDAHARRTPPPPRHARRLTHSSRGARRDWRGIGGRWALRPDGVLNTHDRRTRHAGGCCLWLDVASTTHRLRLRLRRWRPSAALGDARLLRNESSEVTGQPLSSVLVSHVCLDASNGFMSWDPTARCCACVLQHAVIAPTSRPRLHFSEKQRVSRSVPPRSTSPRIDDVTTQRDQPKPGQARLTHAFARRDVTAGLAMTTMQRDPVSRGKSVCVCLLFSLFLARPALLPDARASRRPLLRGQN